MDIHHEKWGFPSGCTKCGCWDCCCPDKPEPPKPCINCPCCVRAMALLLRQLAGSTSTFDFFLTTNVESGSVQGVTIVNVFNDTIVKVSKNGTIENINICEISAVQDQNKGPINTNNIQIANLTLTDIVPELEDCDCCEAALKFIFLALANIVNDRFVLNAKGNINFTNSTVNSTSDVVDGVVKIVGPNNQAILVSLCQVTEIEDQQANGTISQITPGAVVPDLEGCDCCEEGLKNFLDSLAGTGETADYLLTDGNKVENGVIPTANDVVDGVVKVRAGQNSSILSICQIVRIGDL
ncbi:hypothetical protein [Peribacillus acanthi]|uniref:hypothetical protein n=1 Tax=Peribacillus acanthi TaxID=2171554 RepID=UPI00130020D6|nr:hypothetical protein [Peribacillus acanthi]